MATARLNCRRTLGATMIRNRDALPSGTAHETALDCVAAGIAAAQPERVVRESVHVEGTRLDIGDETHDLAEYDAVQVLGGGNAAAHVAGALEDALGAALDGGLVVTDDNHETDTVDVRPADHPIPSRRGVDSTEAVLDRAASADADTLVIAVVTGGGSACLVAPTDDISLGGLQATTRALLDCGATIQEINAVRKHLSTVKGGQFARTLTPARVSALVLSDVVGDDLDVIASGPLVPDPTTFGDALDVLASYDLTVPDSVRDRLVTGARGGHEETPGPDDAAFDRVDTHVVGSNWTAVDAAREAATQRGYDTLVLSTRLRGEARNTALTHAAVAEEMVATGDPVDPPAVVLSGGETTVTVTGEGRGGPNQEFALAAGLDLPVEAVLAAVDTDGIDGDTDAAGALVDGTLVSEHNTAERALGDNDANAYLTDSGAIIETGPTGTNVNDLHVLVVGDPDRGDATVGT